jgi:hypothetical protein
MYPYWLFFSFFALGSILSKEQPRDRRPLLGLLIAWLVITLMIGLRWEIGPDWFSYVNWWHRAGTVSLASLLNRSGADPGFYAFLWVFHRVVDQFWIFSLLMAGIFAAGLVAFARTQTNPWLAIAVAVPYLVVVIGMSGVRQATAIAFVFLALCGFLRQQARKFVGWMLLAASCHASAIFVLPLAGLSFARNRFQAFMLLLITAIVAYYLVRETFGLYSERYFSRTMQSSGTLFRIVMSVIPAVIYVTLNKHFPEPPHERSLWRNFSIAAFLTLPLYFLVPSSTALDRLILYLFPLQIHVLSELRSIRGGRAGYVVTLSVLVYLAAQLFIFLTYGTNNDPYLPYRTIFSSMAE